MSWYELAVTPSIGGSAVLTTALPGLFLVSVAGLALVRCPVRGVVTGAITVLGIGTPAGS